MPIDAEFLKRRLESGIIFYLGARLNREISERYLRKYAKEHADALAGFGLAVALEAIGEKGRGIKTYIEDIVDASADYGLYREMKVLVEKEPICWAQDANTIVCKNFEDLANSTVFIDGVKKTATTDYTVSGDTISLATPLTSGVHDLVIVDGTGRKSFSGKIYV